MTSLSVLRELLYKILTLYCIPNDVFKTSLRCPMCHTSRANEDFLKEFFFLSSDLLKKSELWAFFDFRQKICRITTIRCAAQCDLKSHPSPENIFLYTIKTTKLYFQIIIILVFHICSVLELYALQSQKKDFSNSA